jgi:hypothetical protein
MAMSLEMAPNRDENIQDSVDYAGMSGVLCLAGSANTSA